MKYTRKILTMILAMAISVSHILPVYADTSDLPENGNGEPTELELEDLDPSTLHIHKLGEDIIKAAGHSYQPDYEYESMMVADP